MQVSNWVIIGTAEVFTLIMLLCIFLILHTSKLKKLIKGLQQKVQDLLTDLQQTKRAYAEMQDLLEEDSSDYPGILDEQLENTREYHQTLNPDRDISLDLAEDTPMPRQIASLRHAFLITEKEAALSGEGNTPNWLVIQSKLAAIIGFFKSSNPGMQSIEKDADTIPELQNSLQEKHQHIESLEGNLSEAQREAQEIHNGLQEIEVSSEDKSRFASLLQRLKNAIARLGGDPDSDVVTLTEQITNTVEIVTEDNRGAEELMQLRALTADQHSMINELQKRLKSAQTPEEKTLLINDLAEQLERQKRFVQEAETCIELMDNELQEANSTIRDLQNKVEKLKQDSGSGRQNDMADQIKTLKDAVKRLEDENEQLVMQLGM